ncbi:ABC transporter ATP-binding protein [Collinsella intestinalis]|uniref:ABC transporter ATP-binding protein n=1 Tax=Collinsella intestinalis TaxID=147207 RepID=UPI0019576DA5|nr:ABC transporter ATP-binding protein [Collinsella intestinalis]MBM6907324.1 ABC transporter ATP-binding protein [Collinsella intestinalis]
MAESPTILKVRDLRVSYHTYAGEVKAVRGVSFDVERGRAIAIVGESGCGKSVTAKAIMGLIKGPQGEIKQGSEILYNGENILDYTSKQWQAYRGDDCAIIFQDALAALNPTMRVGKQIMENLIAHRHMSKDEAKAEAIEMLRRVGIPEPEKRFKQYPHQFSGGMRQRVMIAIAFACDPDLLICDEPTTALDVTIQSQILDIIKDLQREHNTSVIMITHDLGVVANIAQTIAVMYSGVIVERGTSEDIFYRARHPYTWALIESVPRLDLKNKQELASIPGMPPDLLNPPVGCPFSTRCKYCMAICKEKMPAFTDFGNGHTAACWLHHPMAPKVDMPDHDSPTTVAPGTGAASAATDGAPTEKEVSR